MQSRYAAELDIARATVARLEPSIKQRTATSNDKHAYWDALDVIRHFQDMDDRARMDDSSSTPTMSYAMPNPVYYADLGKIFISVAGVIILIVIVVSVGAMLASTVS
jgi:hypothetical protein